MSTNSAKYIKDLTDNAVAYAKRVLKEHVSDEVIVEDLQMLYNIDEASARWVLKKAHT